MSHNSNAIAVDSELDNESSELQLDSKLTRVPYLPEAIFSDEIVVLSQEKYYGMSGPAAHIWALLETETTLRDLCTKLMDEFDVSEEVCLQHTKAFVSELLRENLVRIRPQR